MEDNKIIPIVYAVDDNYVPFMCVSLKSIIDNSSRGCFIRVFVLNTGLSDENKEKIERFIKDNSDSVELEYVDVAGRMDKIVSKMHLRDYYTKAIYFRIFIPSLFSQYEKIIYVDCDTVFLGDICELYNVDLKNNIVAAIHEEAMSSYECFGLYSEVFLDVPRLNYFNSGLLVINNPVYNFERIETKFINLMLSEKFEVAPDQDCLNVLLKNRVLLLDVGWNKTPIPDKAFPDGEVKVIHYKLNFKPWHYKGIRYEEYFWKYAEKTPYYDTLLSMLDGYSEADRENDSRAFSNLKQMALDYVKMKRSKKVLG